MHGISRACDYNTVPILGGARAGITITAQPVGFAEFEGADIQHEGYATCDDYPKGACYEWVCSDCFKDLKEEMKWTGAGS